MTNPSKTPDKKRYWIWAAVCVFVLSRLLYLFFLNDRDVLTDFKLIEVRYPGLVAKHLLSGLIMPFWDYQYSSYDGGTLISSLMIAPFFLILGSTSFALAFYGLVNSLLIFLLWWRFAHRFYGERAGWITALLFICAPPLHIKVTLLPSGNHMEINLFIILVLWFFFKIFYRPPKSAEQPSPATAQDFILPGFWAGIGVYFCYSSAVLLLVCFLFWLALDKTGQRIRDYAFLLLAFLLGIAFIFPRLGLFDDSIQREIGTQWPLANWTEFLPRIAGVVFGQLPETFAISSPVYRPAYFLFAAAVLFLLWEHRAALGPLAKGILPVRRLKVRLNDKNKNIFFILFIVVYLLIYAISDFNTSHETESPIRHRYLFLLFPFVFMITAAAIDRLYGRIAHGKKIAGVILFYFVISGLISTGQQLDFSQPGKKIARRLTSPGFSHEMLGTVICSRYALKPDKSLSLLNAVPKEYIPAMYRGFGYEFGINAHLHIEDYRTRITEQRYKEELYKGVSLGIVTEKYFEGTDADNAYLSEMVAIDACSSTHELGRRLLQFVESTPQGDPVKLYQGAGTVLAIQCGLRVKTDMPFTKGHPGDYIRAFDEGIMNGINFNKFVLPHL